jgi:hypothetical protein
MHWWRPNLCATAVPAVRIAESRATGCVSRVSWQYALAIQYVSKSLCHNELSRMKLEPYVN